MQVFPRIENPNEAKKVHETGSLEKGERECSSSWTVCFLNWWSITAAMFSRVSDGTFANMSNVPPPEEDRHVVAAQISVR